MDRRSLLLKFLPKAALASVLFGKGIVDSVMADEDVIESEEKTETEMWPPGEILSLKSNDAYHGITSITESDTVGGLYDVQNCIVEQSFGDPHGKNQRRNRSQIGSVRQTANQGVVSITT